MQTRGVTKISFFFIWLAHHKFVLLHAENRKYKMKSILRTLLLLLCLMIGRVGYGQEVWELVTDYDNLSTTDTYVIAGNTTDHLYEWWTLKNNRVTTAAPLSCGDILSISDNKITRSVSAEETWLLETTGKDDVYYIKSTKGDYYLQYSDGINSLITAPPSKDVNRQWKIHVEDTYIGKTKNHTVIGLFLSEITPNREFAIFENNVGSLSWRSYPSSNYNNISGEEVVLFRKVTDVNASITSAGYATFSSPDALDFSAESGLTVYTASVNAEKMKVTLHEVPSKKVPANTAVVLHGSQGSYKGSIVASAEDLGSNDLKVANSDMNGEAGNIYVLNKVGEDVGFYKLKATGTLKAGKAYIEVPGGSGAPMLSLQDDEVTGLSQKVNGMVGNKIIYYSLDGRRVMHPSKGVFIQNGKKVVIK